MRLTFENYWPVIFLVVIPYLFWVRRSSAMDLSPKHLKLSTILRSVIVGGLVLALMQPILYKASSAVSVVYLLDVSQSVQPGAVKGALDWIQKTNEAGQPDKASFVAFGANSVPFDTLEAMKKVQVSADGRQGSLDAGKTDLSGALDRALRSFEPNHLKRAVLISDGNDNSGDLAAAIARLNRENVHVYTSPLETRVHKDVWVETIMSPPSVTADEQFPVEVHVFSQSDTVGTVQLKKGDETLETRQVKLQQGLNRVAFETRVKDETNSVVLSASVKADSDAFANNNTFRQPVVVNGRPHVLYVESHAPSAQYLQKALQSEGLIVDVANPEDIPSSAAALDKYDALIMSDVDPKIISPLQKQAVESYIRELGGGFILAAGENTYGKDGYSDTPIEKALPVTFDTKKRPPTIAMAIVIDVSGSMSQGQLTIAKEAAKAPLKSLRNSDRFGVLSFNTGFNWVAPIQFVSNRAQLNAGIESLYAGGGTNIYVGLQAAYQALKDAPDEVKTVLLLSDGITQTADFQGLAGQMVKAGINVSSIAVGTVSNRELMADIAMWGKGRAYYINTYDRVPQIFIKETELALGKTLQEQPFLPILKKNVEAFKGIDFAKAPRLLGYVVTKPKPTAEVLLTESWTDEPLLARWQYGLGKAAIFTSDVKTRWASEWIQWQGYAKFWSQVVRETMRRQNDEHFDFKVTRKGDAAILSINAIDKDGTFRNSLQPQVSVIGPNQRITKVDVPQVGPGEYEARVAMGRDGSYVFRASGEDSAGPTRSIEYSYPAEYHFYPPDTQKLRSISSATGGTFQPQGNEIFDARGETTEYPVSLWPWLSALVLILYVVDILLRRVRLFEAQEMQPVVAEAKSA
jgi:Ca-activated chloride channel family protein